MIKWAIIGSFIAIAWLIQARVNEHDRLASKMFDTLEFGKIYYSSGSQFFGENPEDLKMGEKNFRIRIVSLLKDSFSHRQMRKILRDYVDNRVDVQTMMIKIYGEAKVIARQAAKSYAAMLRTPGKDVPSRRRRHR